MTSLSLDVPGTMEKTIMKMFATAALALALAGAAAPALAHGTMAAWYGGQIAEAGDVRIEFAVRDGGIRAWVRDHDDKAVAATGKATLLVGGKKIDVALKPEGEALSADVPVKAADKVAAILALSVDGKPLSARFGQDAVMTPALSPQEQAGKQAFEQVCAVCHGVAMRGSDHAPPLLHPFYAPGSGHGDDAILAAARGGAKAHMWKFGDMPKPEGLKPGQENDVLAYLRAMQAANGLAGTGSTAAAVPMDHGSMPMDHSGHMAH